MPYYTIISKKGVFPPPVGMAERAILSKITLYSHKIMRESREILAQVTPEGETGKLKSKIATWGFRVYSQGAIRFNLGWRNQDFSGVNYSSFVDQGTGLYGPFKTRIVPRQAKNLVWEQHGIKHRAPSVAGQRPQYLLNQAVDKTNEWFLYWLERMRVDMYRKMV